MCQINPEYVAVLERDNERLRAACGHALVWLKEIIAKHPEAVEPRGLGLVELEAALFETSVPIPSPKHHGTP